MSQTASDGGGSSSSPYDGGADRARARAAAARARRRRAAAAAAKRRAAQVAAANRARSAARAYAAAIARKRAVDAARQAAVVRAAAAAARAVAGAKARGYSDSVDGLRRERVQRIQQNRRSSYQVLQAAQRAAAAAAQAYSRGAPVRPTVPGQTPPKPPAGSANDERAEIYRQKEYRRQLLYQYQRQVSQAVNDKKATLRDMEKALRLTKDQAYLDRADNGTIAKLTERYVKAAESVAASYNTLVLEINRRIDKGDFDEARKLYKSKQFRQAAGSYERLFGNGKDPKEDGSFNEFVRDYQSVTQAQTEWWKRQMGAALQSEKKTVAELLHRARREGETAEVKRLEELSKIYNGSTGWVADGVDEHGRTRYRKRTIQEELEHREALRRVEAERLRAEALAEQRRTEMFARKEGLVPTSDGRFVSPEYARLEGDIKRYIGDGDLPAMKTQEDVIKFSDGLVQDWEKRNPRPPAPNRSSSNAVRRAYQSWERRRLEYQRQVYGYFGSGVPQVWDRLLQMPGVSHALSVLQAPVSSIGAGGRVILKASTGSSQVLSISLSDLPRSAKEAMGIGGPVAGLIDLGAELPFGTGSKVAQQALLDRWLKTPEGMAWYRAEVAKHKQTTAEEDKAFTAGFYGDTDIGTKLRALNDYGTRPSSSDAQNLLFQLLADPTNAIPLKFTTYLARAKYAAEGGQASKFLGSSKLGTIRDFVGVDEGKLALRSELDKLVKSMGGKTTRRQVDELLAEVAGVEAKSAREKLIRERLRAMGIDPRLVNDTQLFSLIEQSILDRATRLSKDYKSQRAELEAKMKAAEQAKQQASQARVTAQKRVAAQRKAAGATAQPTAAEKRRIRNKVNALFGRDAEELISPKAVAFYAEDAQGIAVEQSRSYLRRLRNASGTSAASRVKTIGPGRTETHFPLDLFEKMDQEIAAERAALLGRADLLTAKRRGAGVKRGTQPELRDTDPRMLAIKRRVARQNGVSVAAYDEARKVFRGAYVQARNAARIMKDAKTFSARRGKDYGETFRFIRAREAQKEGRKQLEALAIERVGHTPDEIFDEFVSKYSDDGMLRGQMEDLTDFQKASLEEAVKKLSGLPDLKDQDALTKWLMSRNAPDFSDAGLTRDFLVGIGAWSPRRATQFTLGQTSWSVPQEAKFWKDSYGVVPEWVDEAKLRDPQHFNEMFHDQAMYVDQHSAWGVLDGQANLKLRLSGASADEIAEKVLKGDPQLGLRQKRELGLIRKYVVERFGDIVGHIDEAGEAHLTAMPWLMHEDELRVYFANRSANAIAPDLVRNADELDEVQALIEKAMDRYWDKYMTSAADFDYEDVFRLASEIQARLLADPKWAKRFRDHIGDGLGGWATLNRAQVFTNPAFLVANVVDSPIKGSWYALTRRSLMSPGLRNVDPDVLKRAAALTPQDLGIDLETTIYRLKQRKVVDYMLDPLHDGLRGKWEQATAPLRGVYRLAPAGAARAEIAMKMRLARDMWPQVYDEAFARLGNQELADAFARKFVKKEINRMWPTVGDGPLEGLFNEIVPFASYMVKNKVLFLSEVAQHPIILNRIDFIGRYIEAQNRKNWEAEHPGEPLPDNMATRIELPWAPGYFLDIGQFSDATRGLKPLYQDRPISYIDFASQWVRIVNPGSQAGILMLTNALGVTQRIQWKPIIDENGFITGYEKVVTGWTEPWSDKQPGFGSVVWLVEAFDAMEKMGAGGWTNGEVSVLLGKLAMFDAISPVDRGAGLYEVYKMLREKNPSFADAWLNTPDGQLMRDWLTAKMGSLRDVADWLSLDARQDKDPARWFHTQSPAFQKSVKDGMALIDKIQADYESRALGLEPGSQEAKDARVRMLLAISEVYRLHPEMLVSQVYSKTAAEWSQQLAKWQLSQKLDEFFALDKLRPRRADFETQAEYETAREAWAHQKEVFLKTYPQVEATLGRARTDLDRVRAAQDKEWQEVLDRVGRRSEEIKAALAVDDHERADMLYLAQELDFSILERDRVALDFTEDDMRELPGNKVVGDWRGALRRATLLPDFDRIRFNKAEREGKLAEFERDQFYADGMAEVILKAKGGDRFGKFDPAKFVRELRRRPKLLAMYFDKHPGKEAEWRRNEAYVSAIGPWGKALARNDFDGAERIWSNLPTWVKQRYLRTHPDSKMTLDGFPDDRRGRAVGTSRYFGWIQRWAKTFDGPAGESMKFFWSMPKDVRERYFAKHPDKRVTFEANLKFGAELAYYFAADDRAAYLKDHPQLAKWLASRVSSKSRERAAILVAYSAIPKEDAWLKRVFREKYPEVFSQEAKGEARLKKVFDRLAAHPETTPGFEKWRDAIWASYVEMLRHDPRSRPKPLELEWVRRRAGLSAAETSR